MTFPASASYTTSNGHSRRGGTTFVADIAQLHADLAAMRNELRQVADALADHVTRRTPMSDARHRKSYTGQRLAVLDAAGWRCQWPGCTNPATTVDHVIPLAYGGTNDRANLRASCHACNSRGGAAIATEVRRRRLIGRRSRDW